MQMKIFVAIFLVFLFGCIDGSPVKSLTKNDLKGKLAGLVQLLRDKRGCDAVVQSCGHRGECCDIHDQCYVRYHCTEHSWITMWYDWDNCANCNRQAMKCVALHQPGQSSCCHRQDCGKPWK